YVLTRKLKVTVNTNADDRTRTDEYGSGTPADAVWTERAGSDTPPPGGGPVPAPLRKSAGDHPACRERDRRCPGPARRCAHHRLDGGARGDRQLLAVVSIAAGDRVPPLVGDADGECVTRWR